MKTTSTIYLGLLALTLALVTPLRAQDPSAETLQQQGTIPYQTPTTATTAAAAVPANKDLGELDVVQSTPKPDTMTASVSQQYFYNDNVFYTDGGEAGSSAYLGSYNLGFVPYSRADWTPRIQLQYNMVRYNNASSGDFDNENAVFSSTYLFTDDHSWSWTAAVHISRYTAPHINDHEFYQEVVYDNQVNKVMQIGKDCKFLGSGELYFIGGYDLQYHQSNPGIFDRIDNSLSFSLSYFPIHELSISPYVRPVWRDYMNDGHGQRGREDFNLSEGISVTYQPVKYFYVSGNLNHTDDYSNNKGFNYTATIPGVGLTGTIGF